MNLNMLSDFMQVLYIKRKHYSQNKYFPKHTLFSTIYLLQEHKLKHRNYFEQEINMGNFVQAKEYDVHMYASFGGLAFYGFL
jgi:hypothetical protein